MGPPTAGPFNPSQAKELFDEALEIEPKNAAATLGLALVASDGFESKAVEFAQKAIELDPKLVEAQELLARLALEDNNPEKATVEADKAIAMSAESLDAMAIRASIDLLNDKPYAVDRPDSENQSGVWRSAMPSPRTSS